MRFPWTFWSIVLGVVLCVSWLASPAWGQESGKDLFLKYKCNRCHSIQAEGIEATSERMKKKTPDLSNVGNRVESAEWIVKWIKREIERDGKKHRGKFKGTDEELNTIAQWLMTLKHGENP